MDWYYPILGGVLRGYPAHARLTKGWGAFVVDNRGSRCVSDRPWVTAAETCELVMSLDAVGGHEHAHMLLRSVQFLPVPKAGGTGPAPTSRATRSTSTASSTRWSSPRGLRSRGARRGTACGDGPTAGLFRGERLPEGLGADELLAAGVEIEQARAERGEELAARDEACRAR